jgi:hypothetical protein
VPSARDIKAGGAYVQLYADDAPLKKKLDGASAAMKRFKAQFGEESLLGNFSKILVGTGAVAGLSLLGRAVADTTGRVVTLKDQFNAGTLSAGQVALELGKSVPILGNLVTAATNLHELFTGSAAEARVMAEQLARVNALFEARQRVVGAIAESTKATGQAMRDLIAQGQLIGQSGPWAEWISQQQQLIRQQDEVRATFLAQAKAVREQATVEIAGADGKTIKKTLHERRNEIESELARIRDSSLRRGLFGNAISEEDLKKLNALRTELALVNQALKPVEDEIRRITAEMNRALGIAFGNFGKSGLSIFTEALDKIVHGFRDKAREMSDAVKGVDQQLGDFFDPIERGFAQRAEQINRSVRTPVEIASEEIAEIDQFEDAGLLDPESAARARGAARQRFEDMMKAQRGLGEAVTRMLSRSEGTFNPFALDRTFGAGPAGGAERTNDLLAQLIDINRNAAKDTHKIAQNGPLVWR